MLKLKILNVPFQHVQRNILLEMIWRFISALRIRRGKRFHATYAKKCLILKNLFKFIVENIIEIKSPENQGEIKLPYRPLLLPQTC